MAQDAVPIDQIQTRIVVLRGHRILLDADIVAFYGASTKTLNQAVKRNEDRFPPDFRFQLTDEGRGGRRYLPLPSLNTAPSWPRQL